MSTLIPMFGSRGLAVDRINPREDLLSEDISSREPRLLELLDHYGARLLIREIIKLSESDDPETVWRKGRGSVQRFCTPDSITGYIEELADMGIIELLNNGIPKLVRQVSSFGSTYEWFVAKILEREFGVPSAWGVRFSGQSAGGDHDVVADLSGSLLYMEVKTSPPKHVEYPEIAAFVNRLSDIGPDLAILHEDTHLRMKDKIVPLMERAVGDIHDRVVRFARLEREIFHLDAAVYIVNSKPDLRRNLSAVFRHYWRCRSRVVQTLSKT